MDRAFGSTSLKLFQGVVVQAAEILPARKRAKFPMAVFRRDRHGEGPPFVRAGAAHEFGQVLLLLPLQFVVVRYSLRSGFQKNGMRHLPKLPQVFAPHDRAGRDDQFGSILPAPYAHLRHGLIGKDAGDDPFVAVPAREFVAESERALHAKGPCQIQRHAYPSGIFRSRWTGQPHVNVKAALIQRPRRVVVVKDPGQGAGLE